MAEVYTISGALGQAPCPAGWAVTPNGNCGAPVAGCPPSMRVGNACRSDAAVALQNAVKTLGKAVGDAQLAALVVDGFVGPKTVAATNKALAAYAGRANPRFRTGSFSQAQVANEAGLITSIVSAESAARGAPVPPPPVVARMPSAAPEAIPTPTMLPELMAGKALWAVVGLNAVAAATGFWMAYRGRRMRGFYPATA